MLMGIAGLVRNAASVSTTMMATSTKPPPANVRATDASNVVSMLKWDGTPRQACRVTSAVSSAQATVKAPSSIALARSLRRRNDATQTIVISVRPNDNPKVIGLRKDNGPRHEPSPMMRIVRWISPLANNSAPTTQAARSVR